MIRNKININDSQITFLLYYFGFNFSACAFWLIVATGSFILDSSLSGGETRGLQLKLKIENISLSTS